ncbi:MAG: dihydrofolate reductase family protein [Collinsella sp.]|nr:dihydrofolate reductase family protein [Collinsella sp.]
MRKTVLYIAMSLDGFIADEQGGVGWLSGHGEDISDPGGYEAFIKTIGTVVMGRATFDQIVTELSPDAWPYEGLESYVISSREAPPCAPVHFTRESPVELVERLRVKEGRDIWICGGARVAQSLLAAGLIDSLRIFVIPTLLGGGVRLFGPLGEECPLRLVGTREQDGIVELSYVSR